MSKHRGSTFSPAQVWRNSAPEFAEAKIKEVGDLLGELAETDEIVRPCDLGGGFSGCGLLSVSGI